MAQANKICQICGELGHSKFYCLKRPRKALPPPTKRIRPAGKSYQRWQSFRIQWFIDHPAPYFCFYCLIEYGEQRTGELPKEEVTLDHYLPRGSHSQLAYVDSNIVPCCWFHNGDKGSIHGDKYVEKIKKRASA